MVTKRLNRKVLLVLSLSVAVITAIIILVTNYYLQHEISREFRIDSQETMSVIASGIKQTMASGNSLQMESQLLDLKTENPYLDLFVTDPEQNIIFSTDEKSLRSKLDTQIRNREMLSDLRTSFSAGVMPDTVYEEDQGGSKFFMHAHIVLNQPECFRCHGSREKYLGAVILRKPVDRSFAAIRDVTRTNVLISILGVGMIIVISHLMVARLISGPIRELSRKIASLPDRIASGTLVGNEDIDREDEIGDLQRAFQNMAVDLYEKTHAIQKSNADLANANRELEAFAYSVSHDLRAPLRNIDGFSKILMDDFAAALPDKAKHYLKRVRNGTTRMSTLIDDILTFSRIGRTDVDFKKIPCAAIVRSVLANFSDEIERRGVTVTVGDLPEINCDPSLMQSLFLNLISNALKFTRNAEKAEITIGFDSMRKVLYVRDNGVGFDTQYHDKIFQVFQRLFLPEEYEGTGIGLAIVKRIAERHHGRVWAESQPGKGATFYIDIPTF